MLIPSRGTYGAASEADATYSVASRMLLRVCNISAPSSICSWTCVRSLDEAVLVSAAPSEELTAARRSLSKRTFSAASARWHSVPHAAVKAPAK